MNKMTILIISIVVSIPLFFITLALALSGYIIGAKIIMTIGLISYPLLAIWVVKHCDEIFDNIELR